LNYRANDKAQATLTVLLYYLSQLSFRVVGLFSADDENEIHHYAKIASFTAKNAAVLYVSR